MGYFEQNRPACDFYWYTCLCARLVSTDEQINLSIAGVGEQRGAETDLHDPAEQEDPIAHDDSDSRLAQEGGHQERKPSHRELKHKENEKGVAKRVVEEKVNLEGCTSCHGGERNDDDHGEFPGGPGQPVRTLQHAHPRHRLSQLVFALRHDPRHLHMHGPLSGRGVPMDQYAVTSDTAEIRLQT